MFSAFEKKKIGEVSRERSWKRSIKLIIWIWKTIREVGRERSWKRRIKDVFCL